MLEFSRTKRGPFHYSRTRVQASSIEDPEIRGDCRVWILGKPQPLKEKGLKVIATQPLQGT